MAERRVAARLSMSKLKRRRKIILPCAMPESTEGGETKPPRRTWDRVPQRKLASRCQRRPGTPKSKRRTRVASTQQESKAFLMSMNAAKVCSWRHQRKPLGRVELWKNVGRNASIDQVLENFESAGCERDGTIGIKRGRVTIALDDRNN